jgi:hypothetical protein
VWESVNRGYKVGGHKHEPTTDAHRRIWHLLTEEERKQVLANSCQFIIDIAREQHNA